MKWSTIWKNKRWKKVGNGEKEKKHHLTLGITHIRVKGKTWSGINLTPQFLLDFLLPHE